jgi:hypothetical protein
MIALAKRVASLALSALLLFLHGTANAGWNNPLTTGGQRVKVFLSNERVEILGDLRTDEISANATGPGLYGTPGGGWASVFGMMLAHGLLLSSQQQAELDNLTNRMKEIGRPLTEQLNGITKKELFVKALLQLSEYERSVIIADDIGASVVSPKNSEASNVNFTISVSKEYRSLVLTMLVSAPTRSDANAFRVDIINQKSASYINDQAAASLSFSVEDDVVAMMAEGLRVFLRRDTLFAKGKSPQRTLRSAYDGKRRFDRGYLVEETCDRHLFIDLSGRWVAARKAEGVC